MLKLLENEKTKQDQLDELCLASHEDSHVNIIKQLLNQNIDLVPNMHVFDKTQEQKNYKIIQLWLNKFQLLQNDNILGKQTVKLMNVEFTKAIIKNNNNNPNNSRHVSYFIENNFKVDNQNLIYIWKILILSDEIEQVNVDTILQFLHNNKTTVITNKNAFPLKKDSISNYCILCNILSNLSFMEIPKFLKLVYFIIDHNFDITKCKYCKTLEEFHSIDLYKNKAKNKNDILSLIQTLMSSGAHPSAEWENKYEHQKFMKNVIDFKEMTHQQSTCIYNFLKDYIDRDSISIISDFIARW